MQQLDLIKYFTLKLEIPFINSDDELTVFLREHEAFGNEAAREDAVSELRSLVGDGPLSVGVRQVIGAVDFAISQGGNTAADFARNVLGQMEDR